MKRPAEITRSREDGEALRKRLAGDRLTAHDRQGLGHVLEGYFWRRVALQEARCSLKRLRTLVCGETPKQRKPKPPKQSSGARAGDGGPGAAVEQRRPGHGRHGAQAYGGAPRGEGRPETLAVGQRCPVCGVGRLYVVPPGGAMRIDGNARLSARRYELERRRGSACGQVCTATGPWEARAEKYTARARATLAGSRYSLGGPMYRLAAYPALVGVPVADATQWEQIARVADCADPIFEELRRIAAHGKGLYQAETHVRMVSLMAANARLQTERTRSARTGRHPPALVATHGPQTICL